MLKSIIYAFIATILLFPAGVSFAGTPDTLAVAAHDSDERPLASHLLVIGDSMTGWLAEDLAAYGAANGFKVSTVVWDGSTIPKWGANAAKISSYIKQIDPDAVVICLGLNNVGERKPSSLTSPVEKILKACGNLPVLWVGPPSWPGKNFGNGVDRWLNTELGEGRYFSTCNLTLTRQSKTNPHPSRAGMATLVKALMQWLPDNCVFRLPDYRDPGSKTKRPSPYIYRKMKQPL